MINEQPKLKLDHTLTNYVASLQSNYFPRYQIKMIMYTLEQLHTMAIIGKDGKLFV